MQGLYIQRNIGQPFVETKVALPLGDLGVQSRIREKLKKAFIQEIEGPDGET